MKILVVDDNRQHLAAARLLSEMHHVTIADSYEQAIEIINSDNIDVLLTDLLMPAETCQLGVEGLSYLGHEIPIGLVLAIFAAQMGVRYVAVVTDVDRHCHPMSAAVDWVSHQSRGKQHCFFINKAKAIATHAPMKDGAKDWVAILGMFKIEE